MDSGCREVMDAGRGETREKNFGLLCSRAEPSRGGTEVQTKVFPEAVRTGLHRSEGTLTPSTGLLSSVQLSQLFLRLWAVGAGATIVRRKRRYLGSLKAWTLVSRQC